MTEDFTVIKQRYNSELMVAYNGIPIGAVSTTYARTFAAALLTAADKAEKDFADE